MALYPETRKIQEELNKKFDNGSSEPIPSLFSKIQKNRSQPLMSSPAPSSLEESVLIAPKDRRNYSRFFGENYDPSYNLEDIAADRQGGLERVAYMIPRIATKVVSEVAQMPGYLGGAVAWGAAGFDPEKLGLMVDNFWIRGIQKAEEATKDTLTPVYVSDEVKQGGLMKNIFSTSFWATEGADGIGFLLAFLVPGQVLKSAELGAKAARLIKPGIKATKLLRAGATPAEATALATAKMAENIDLVAAASINTIFESAAEAGETFRTIENKTGDREAAGRAAVDE